MTGRHRRGDRVEYVDGPLQGETRYIDRLPSGGIPPRIRHVVPGAEYVNWEWPYPDTATAFDYAVYELTEYWSGSDFFWKAHLV